MTEPNTPHAQPAVTDAERAAREAERATRRERARTDLDEMSYLDNGVIRLGIDLDLGGSITYLADAKDGLNLVNNADWGRQIQMSFYSGPVPFIPPSGKEPVKHWAKLGWNPIQSGDYAHNRAKVLEHRNDGKSLYVKCIPMQWPHDNVPGDCTFESWLELDGNAVHARARINNAREDKTQYPARSQELPAVYTNGPFYRILTYSGDRPYTGGELTTIPAKFPWSGFSATENWAALLNEQDWGLGVWFPGVYHVIGGFAGKPGAGGPKDGPTGYIAPLHSEVLDHNIVYEYTYDLIVGDLAQIRQYVYDRAERKALPDYHFKADRQHWTYENITDKGWPIQGQLEIEVTAANPAAPISLTGPQGFWAAADAPRMYLRAACQTGQPRARLYWLPFGEKDFTAANSVTFDLIPDGDYHDYEIDLSAAAGYRGNITRLRLEPFAAAANAPGPGTPGAAAGDWLKVRSLSHRRIAN